MNTSEEIDQLRTMVGPAHHGLANAVFAIDQGLMGPFDFLAYSAINRSLCLMEGFALLLTAENLVAAGPLVRLQLDSAIRIFAWTLVDSPHTYAMNIISGVPPKKQKDRSGKQMNDGYLVDKLEDKRSGARALYDFSSGYVHLSNRHYENSSRAVNITDPEIELKVSARDKYVRPEHYTAAIQAFAESTDILFAYIDEWIRNRLSLAKHDV